MFQSFDLVNDPSKGAARLAALRGELERRGLDGFLVPLADEHQGEYIPPGAARLAWLTGFTGSAGIAVVLADRAAIFVDGRYVLQVREQVDTEAFEPRHLFEDGWDRWLEDALAEGRRIGYDPWLHTMKQAKTFARIAEATGAAFVACDTNPLDAVWEDRPAPPAGRVSLHPEALAGRGATDKVADMQAALGKARTGATVLTQPDSIAWLLNIRGADVPHNPVPLCFVLLPAEGRPTLFVDARKIGERERTALKAVCDIAGPDALAGALDGLGGAGATVRLDPATTAEWIASRLRAAGARIVEGEDPCVLPKATKTPAEIAGARAAHLRDGAAMARFLHWFDRAAPTGTLDEISAAEALERFRAATGRLKDISFDTISGAGANGAIVHYRVTRASNRRIEAGTLYLTDSGAQYEDGTTDITRTVAVGEPDAGMRRHFTLVLRGHIAVATARFPVGTTGAQIDTLARHALWQAGLDYDHGTGHGIGSYLSVHEGPQRIAKSGTVKLEPGMILSNEPGYYRTGEYGIRIENLVLVGEPFEVEGGERRLLAFETLTLAPIDRRLVDTGLMSAGEIAWLDAYHARVLAAIGPLLDDSDRAWLERATAPLGEG